MSTLYNSHEKVSQLLRLIGAEKSWKENTVGVLQKPMIYWLQSPSSVVLLDIYSKSEQENIEVAEIQRILLNYEDSS